jgi:MFS family permease
MQPKATEGKESYRIIKNAYLKRVRLATSLFFFGMGFSFATWASRIPDIKSMLHLSEAALGTLLFALPMGQLVAMPFSGKLVTRYGSWPTTLIGLVLYAGCLPLIGLAQVQWHLAAGLFLFGLTGNVCNIAVNTQGVQTQHGIIPWLLEFGRILWCFGGLRNAGLQVGPLTPFLYCFYLCTVDCSDQC